MTKEFISILPCPLQQWNHFPSRRHTQSQLEQIKWQFEILFFLSEIKDLTSIINRFISLGGGQLFRRSVGTISVAGALRRRRYQRNAQEWKFIMERCMSNMVLHFFCCTSNRLDFLHEAFNTNLISCPRELILDGDKIPCCCGNFRGCNFCQSTLKPFVLNVL